jgi:hypothetical protein
VGVFLWACHSFAETNEMDTFAYHFEIHWANNTITVDDEDKEAQYDCCTFQTRRINKNQPPVELAQLTRTSGLISGIPTGFTPLFW